MKKDRHNYKMDKLKSIQFNLTNFCSQKCVMCRKYKWPDNSLKFDVLKNEIAKLDKNTSVILSGGEPLLYTEINKVIEILNENKIHWSILTNAMVFNTNLDKAEYINISFDAFSNKTYNKIRGVNSFTKIVNNIKKMKEQYDSEKILLDCTVSKLNVHEIPLLLNFAYEMDMYISFQCVHTFNNLIPSRNDIAKLLKNISNKYINKLPKTNLFIFLEQYFNGNLKSNVCRAIRNHMIIDADGSVFPCCRALNDNGNYKERSEQNILGNIYEDTIYNIFLKSKNSIRLNELIQKKGIFCKMCDRYNMYNTFYERFITNNILFM